MKKYGKIIIAFMWLGLTMIMIVGATFAWFAENRNVQADGMQVQAETVKNLLISTDAQNAEFATSATSTLGLKTLAPASSETAASDATFFAAIDETRTNGYIDVTTGAIAGTPNPAAPFRAANINDLPASGDQHIEVAKHTFKVKTDGQSLGNLYIKSLTVVNNSAVAAAAEISKALRVAVVCGSNHYIFAPVTGATAEYKAITSTAAGLSTNNVTLSTITNDGLTGTTPQCLLANTVTSTAIDVVVYIWYEGQDANCTSANSANVEQLSVKLVFAALEASN